MKQFFIITALCLAFGNLPVLGQDNPAQPVNNAFRNFQYKRVIALSDSILLDNPNMNNAEIIELLRMRALAYYSLNDEILARSSFLEILKTEPDFALDPIRNSPKIITFFQHIKQNYTVQPEKENPGLLPEMDSPELKKKQVPFRNGLARSLIFPGWGHFYYGKKKRGTWIALAGASTLIPSIYYFYRTNDLENKYLNETDKSQINKRYEDYNQSYKIRNIFIAAYAAAWLYAQLDLTADLFSSKNLSLENNVIEYAGSNSFTIGIRYTF